MHLFVVDAFIVWHAVRVQILLIVHEIITGAGHFGKLEVVMNADVLAQLSLLNDTTTCGIFLHSI